MTPAEFVRLMLAHDVLQFGDFELKSGRRSPYFFNLGRLDSASGLALLGRAYAQALAAHGWDYDVLFGPAYKGIPIASATAVALAAEGADPGVAYNRKEAKDHGEGGTLVGASIRGRRVVVIDDVLTAGTAVREALALITAAGGRLAGVLVALDRQERMSDAPETAISALQAELNVPVASIVSLEDVMGYLDSEPLHSEALHSIRKYFEAHCLPRSGT